MLIESLFGTIALITSIVGLLPQVYKSFKTKSTQDLCIIMLINYLICSVAWIIYGFCIRSWVVVASNVVGLITSLLLIALKKFYDKRVY